MIKIRKVKSFIKAFDRLPKRIKPITIEKIRIFSEDRHNSELHDHALKGRMKGKRAFWITNDFRIVYRIENDIFVFLDTGKHTQVYQKL